LHSSGDTEKLSVSPALYSVVFKLCDLLSICLSLIFVNHANVSPKQGNNVFNLGNEVKVLCMLKGGMSLLEVM
jgi:hypothetical protein